MDKSIKYSYKKYIIVGSSNVDGFLIKPYEEAKACNCCINFKSCDLHAFIGQCTLNNKSLSYKDYKEQAKNCDSFKCPLNNLVSLI